MRKIFAFFIAIFLLSVSAPVPSFAGEKEKTHKTRKQRKAEKKQKKKWAKASNRSNAYRFPREKHVGERMFKRQTPKEQKKRSKHHLKP